MGVRCLYSLPEQHSEGAAAEASKGKQPVGFYGQANEASDERGENPGVDRCEAGTFPVAPGGRSVDKIDPSVPQVRHMNSPRDACDDFLIRYGCIVNMNGSCDRLIQAVKSAKEVALLDSGCRPVAI